MLLTFLSVCLFHALPALAISQYQFAQLNNVIRYAKVSYCMDDLNFTTGSFAEECPNDWCKNHPGIEIVSTVRPENDLASGTGFVAVDEGNKEVFVVFRGSETLGDWMTDFTVSQCNYAPVIGSGLKDLNLTIGDDEETINNAVAESFPYPLCPGECKIHCGVLVQSMQFMDEIYEATVPYLQLGYNLTVTGHSLGGAYAALAGLEFKLQGHDPLVITYAALKIGNEDLNAFVDSTFDTQGLVDALEDGEVLPYGSYARVVNNMDVIPLLPPFDHYTKSGVWFELNGTETPQRIDQVIYRGVDNNDIPDFIEEAELLLNTTGDNTLAYHRAYFIQMGEPCSVL